MYVCVGGGGGGEGEWGWRGDGGWREEDMVLDIIYLYTKYKKYD